MVPELGATLGYLLTAHLRATVGYTFMYVSRVARPGDQIDLDLNPSLLPPEAEPFTGPLRPAFAVRDTDFWAQGLRWALITDGRTRGVRFEPLAISAPLM